MLYTYNGTNSYLLEYIHKCKSGEILVGHELLQGLKRFEDDFKNPDIRKEFEDAHK